MIPELNERSREIFRFIVDSYLATGSPVGSRTISQRSGITLSPASIRNTMADLEDAGLLFSPHTSAGRLPTEMGLRLYIDGLMQVGGLSPQERRQIEGMYEGLDPSVNVLMEQTSSLLAGLSSCASLVIAPKSKKAVESIQFVQLQPRKIMIVLLLKNGLVENRVLDTDEDYSASSLQAAANYLNARLNNKTIEEAVQRIHEDIAQNKTQLDALTQDLVLRGLAVQPKDKSGGHIIIRGQSRLLEDVKALEDLERARALMNYLEEQQNMLNLLGAIDAAESVQIFIGAENQIFDQSGWSMIVSPYKNSEQEIVGAIGVIGPTRLNYDRIIPMVDYTSKVIQKIIEKAGG